MGQPPMLLHIHTIGLQKEEQTGAGNHFSVAWWCVIVRTTSTLH